MKKDSAPEFIFRESVMNTRFFRRTDKEKRVYVFGHRNPDTDCMAAAAAYAALKRSQGMANCHAARAGKASPQTEYAFNRFQTPLPEFIPDLLPKVGYYYNPAGLTLDQGMSVWDAMSMLQTSESAALPVVDGEGRYKSLLHYRFFAQNILKVSNPRRKTVIQTSLGLLASVLHAQALTPGHVDEIRKSPIVVASAEFDSFKAILSTYPPENAIVISGNRREVHGFAIESGVRALVITNGAMPDRRHRELAEKMGVAILVSPYDTSSSTMLLIYSMPVSAMSNADIRPVRLGDPIRKVAAALASAPGKSLPVVDESEVVIGVLSEADLYHEANIELILVDHNELTQAVEGAENYRVLEIIDHHRLGAIATRQPITFINKPVGATSTIVAGLFRESQVPLGAKMASLLLCGILSDTLVLQSATASAADREMAEYLANLANLDLEELGRGLMNAASNISGRDAGDLVRQDMKTYGEGGCSFAVSQIEVGSFREALTRKAEFVEALERERLRANSLFSALLVTDTTLLTSLLVMAAEPSFLQFVNLPKQEESVYAMKDVVSRKKQLMPILSELVDEYQRR